MTNTGKFKFFTHWQNARFVQDDDGAVSVDWVVLTAAIVGLAAVGSATIGDAIEALSGDISDSVSGRTVDNGNGPAG